MNEEELQQPEAVEADQLDQAAEETDGSQTQEEETGTMLYADYTRKTQALAEDRRAMEAEKVSIEAQKAILEQIEAAKADPEAFDQLLDELQGIRRQKFGDPVRVEEGDFTEGEASLLKKFSKLESQVNKIVGTITSQVESQKNQLAAQNAAIEFKNQTGIEVTPEEVVKAVRETGITNPLYALKVANFDRKTAPAPSKKPISPGSKDPEKLVVNESTGWAQIMAAREKGIPIE